MTSAESRRHSRTHNKNNNEMAVNIDNFEFYEYISRNERNGGCQTNEMPIPRKLLRFNCIIARSDVHKKYIYIAWGIRQHLDGMTVKNDNKPVPEFLIRSKPFSKRQSRGSRSSEEPYHAECSNAYFLVEIFSMLHLRFVNVATTFAIRLNCVSDHYTPFCR